MIPRSWIRTHCELASLDQMRRERDNLPPGTEQRETLEEAITDRVDTEQAIDHIAGDSPLAGLTTGIHYLVTDDTPTQEHKPC